MAEYECVMFHVTYALKWVGMNVDGGRDYLERIGPSGECFWTKDRNKSLRFATKLQALAARLHRPSHVRVVKLRKRSK